MSPIHMSLEISLSSAGVLFYIRRQASRHSGNTTISDNCPNGRRFVLTELDQRGLEGMHR